MSRLKNFITAICFAYSSQLFATTVNVFAAASLGNVLDALVEAFQNETKDSEIRLSLAGSSVLARQIAAGAPAHLFISANSHWVDYLQTHNHVEVSSRDTLAHNQLVLISAQPGDPMTLDANTDFLALLGQNRLALALVDAVPAGMYAKAALQSLGQWERIQGSLAQADNVRAALKLVALGEAPYGIVYATDAKAEPRVYQRGVFSRESHPRISYTSAEVANKDAESRALANAFHRFLYSDRAKAIFDAYGFQTAD